MKTPLLFIAACWGICGSCICMNAAACGEADPRKDAPLWDGKETVAEYAQRAGLEATKTLDLGGGVTLDLVLIPAGKFLMGSPATEEDHSENEGPQHEVTISQPFYLGKYEVTQAQFVALMRYNPSHFEGAKNPVDQATWDEAQEFCRRVNEKTGKDARLPTEAEWEYACRAGTKTRFHTGNRNEDLARAGWYGAYTTPIGSEQTTNQVGQKLANAFGLYDMHGNVWEWCQDWYGRDYYKKSPETDPSGPASGEERILRGGSWFNDPRSCSAAVRYWSWPYYRNIDIGFRVAVGVGAKAP